MESARIRARHSSGSGVSSILQPVNGVRYVCPCPSTCWRPVHACFAFCSLAIVVCLCACVCVRVRVRVLVRVRVCLCVRACSPTRDAMRRKGKAPRDHARDNIRAMRDQQRMNRAAREEEERRRDAGFKMKRFQNVSSRVDRSGVRRCCMWGCCVPCDGITLCGGHRRPRKSRLVLPHHAQRRSSSERAPSSEQSACQSPNRSAATDLARLPSPRPLRRRSL